MKDPSDSQFASPQPRLVRRIRQRKQPVQDRSRATTEAVLAATLQVLLRDGYAHLTTTRVAERAGVSVGTLYQYFPDKRSLVMALTVRYFETMVGAVRVAAASARDLSLERALRAIVGALLAVKRDNLQLALALRAPLADGDGAGLVRDTLTQFCVALAPTLAHHAPGLDGRHLAMLVAAFDGAVSFAVFEHPEWLGEPWFADNLVTLGLGYVRRARSA
jgi:AcrR family transcriptional regulator